MFYGHVSTNRNQATRWNFHFESGEGKTIQPENSVTDSTKIASKACRHIRVALSTYDDKLAKER